MKFAHDITDLAPIEAIEQAYTEKKYIVTKHGVFQIMYSQAQQQYSAMRLLISDMVLTEEEYELLTGQEVNERIDHKLVVED
jgi:hypothetical protein